MALSYCWIWAGDQADEVVRVRIGRQQVRWRCVNAASAASALPSALLQQAEVVPRAHVAIVGLHRGLEDLLARRLVPLQARGSATAWFTRRRRQASDPRADASCSKYFSADSNFCWFIVRDAQVVQAHRIGGRRDRGGRLRGREQGEQEKRGGGESHTDDYLKLDTRRAEL